MNRQLKEFAEQAGYPDYMTYGQDLVLERFAKLIIRECADIALKSGNVTNKSIEAKVEAERIHHKIQDHFGD